MTKPTLDAAPAKAAADDATSPEQTAAPVPANDTTDDTNVADTTGGGPADTSSDDGNADESPSSDVKGLPEFRAAFGHELGSVYFADETPFVDACVTHMATLNATIVEQTKEADTLKAEVVTLKEQNAELAKKVHGEASPLEVEEENQSAEVKGKAEKMGTAKATYAASLKDKLK